MFSRVKLCIAAEQPETLSEGKFHALVFIDEQKLVKVFLTSGHCSLYLFPY